MRCVSSGLIAGEMQDQDREDRRLWSRSPAPDDCIDEDDNKGNSQDILVIQELVVVNNNHRNIDEADNRHS